jgi:hypothetical protein
MCEKLLSSLRQGTRCEMEDLDSRLYSDGEARRAWRVGTIKGSVQSLVVTTWRAQEHFRALTDRQLQSDVIRPENPHCQI